MWIEAGVLIWIEWYTLVGIVEAGGYRTLAGAAIVKGAGRSGTASIAHVLGDVVVDVDGPLGDVVDAGTVSVSVRIVAVVFHGGRSWCRARCDGAGCGLRDGCALVCD